MKHQSRKSIETKNILVVARGWGKGYGGRKANGYRVYISDDKNILKSDSGNSYMIL